MLSRQLYSLQVVGRDSQTTAAPPLLAFPPHPKQLLLTGIPPADHHSLGVVLSPSRPLRQTSDCLHRTTAHTQSEHVESATSTSYSCQPTSREAARRRMMPAAIPFSSTQPIPARHIRFTFPSHDTANPVFTFRHPSPQPEMILCFPPRPSPSKPRKRPRAVADVDGEHSCLHKKKRRLRLFLITSRLSPQFSHPATNIVDRGSSKIAVWAKQKALGRNLMRKAAILNRIRWRAIAAREAADGLGRVLVEQEKEQEQLKLAKLAFVYGSHDTHTHAVLQKGPSHDPAEEADHFEIRPPISDPSSKSPSPPMRPRRGGDSDDDISTAEYCSPNDAYSYSPPRSKSPRRSYLPLPPSPLGLSNYDAFDVEDDIPDPYAHLDDDDDDDDGDNGYYNARGQDEDMRSSSLSGAAASRPSTARKDGVEAFQSSPQSIYSDFSILEPDEPVVGDYDQIDDGADAVWPSTFVSDTEANSTRPLSSSPDFHALFAATTQAGTSLSPNFTASSLDSPPSPMSISPNFVTPPTHVNQPQGSSRRNSSEIEQERERQRSFMFMHFGT